LVFAVLRTLNSTASVNLLRYLPANGGQHKLHHAIRTQRTNQGSLRLSLSYEFLCPDISLFEVGTATFDFESADIAVAIEPLFSERQWFPSHFGEFTEVLTYRIVLDKGRQLWVWHDSVESAIDL
jgi:hypothetical protein